MASFVQKNIDDGFGITEANKQEFDYWVPEFNLLRETITIDKFKYGNEVDFIDLFVFKGDRFFEDGKLDNLCFKKKKTNLCIPQLIVVIKHRP